MGRLKLKETRNTLYLVDGSAEITAGYVLDTSHIDEYSRDDIANFVVRWFQGDISNPKPPGNCTLNVAGPRESNALGIQHAVMVRMIDVISALNGKLFYPLPDDSVIYEQNKRDDQPTPPYGTQE